MSFNCGATPRRSSTNEVFGGSDIRLSRPSLNGKIVIRASDLAPRAPRAAGVSATRATTCESFIRHRGYSQKTIGRPAQNAWNNHGARSCAFLSCPNARAVAHHLGNLRRNGKYGYYHCGKCRGVRAPRELVEQRFSEHLERLTPDPAYMKLFRAVVLDAWQHEATSAREVAEALAARVCKLEAKLDRLERYSFVTVQSIAIRTQASGTGFERSWRSQISNCTMLESKG